MANWFVDTTLATGNNNGTTMDDAWQSIETAMEYGSFSAGDNVWIRRVSSFSGATSNIELASDGSSTSWLSFIGWPRNSHSISSSDWTNGSTEVTVDDNDMDREKHQSRYITAPDSRVYFITRVVDSNTIIIDREYVGLTASNAAATISADEDYATAQLIDDSAWTIKKTDYNGDADDLPVIDFEATSYYVFISGDNYIHFKNLEFKNGANTTAGSFYPYSVPVKVTGCLFSQTNNAVVLRGYTNAVTMLTRCTIEGSGSGASQRGIMNGLFELTDCAIYNTGVYCLQYISGYFRNVNIGVEVASSTHEIACVAVDRIIGYDVKLGGTVGYVYVFSPTGSYAYLPNVSIENFGKVLGAHFFAIGENTSCVKQDVVAGSGDPYKRTDGSDSVLSLTLPGSTYGPDIKERARPVIDHTVYADTSSKSYRYYVQLKDIASLTADQLYLECTYVSGYDDTSEYQTTTVYSDETPVVRTGADDWSQYIEVTGIQPAVASNVHLRVRVQGYDADGYIFIDPLVVIS